MPTKVARLEILDSIGGVVKTHHIPYSSEIDNTIVISIGKYVYFLNDDGEITIKSLRDDIDKQIYKPITT
ncbi:MAG: hypothetical protein WC333_01940 [Dehalococcoidia bacterium]|jgi:hypothetical protein